MAQEQQQVPIVNRAGGGIICANCGGTIIPVKSKISCGALILFFILGIFPAIIYAIYYAGKRVDLCPVCEKNAYIKEIPVTKDESNPKPVSRKTVIIVTASVVGFIIWVMVLAYIFK